MFFSSCYWKKNQEKKIGCHLLLWKWRFRFHSESHCLCNLLVRFNFSGQNIVREVYGSRILEGCQKNVKVIWLFQENKNSINIFLEKSFGYSKLQWNTLNSTKPISLTYARHYKLRLVYIYPFFEAHFFFKEVFSENSVLMYG